MATDVGPSEHPGSQMERVVLQELLALHPDRLTIPELVLKVAVDPDDGSESEDIAHTARDLRASDLLRFVDGVLEPTHAALCAASLLI